MQPQVAFQSGISLCSSLHVAFSQRSPSCTEAHAFQSGISLCSSLHRLVIFWDDGSVWDEAFQSGISLWSSFTGSGRKIHVMG